MTSQQTHPNRNGPTRSQDSGLAIDAQNVTVTYEDGTEAVRGVSLRIESGEFFGFLGPNGAGKTTTIKALATLLGPTEGSVRINGYDAATEPENVRRSIGYMAQETSIDTELTPRENLRLACKLYGVPVEQREERIEALLDLVELQDVADTRSRLTNSFWPIGRCATYPSAETKTRMMSTVTICATSSTFAVYCARSVVCTSGLINRKMNPARTCRM